MNLNIGKALFAQLMEFILWSGFFRIVSRHRDDEMVRLRSETNGAIQFGDIKLGCIELNELRSNTVAFGQRVAFSNEAVLTISVWEMNLQAWLKLLTCVSFWIFIFIESLPYG